MTRATEVRRQFGGPVKVHGCDKNGAAVEVIASYASLTTGELKQLSNKDKDNIKEMLQIMEQYAQPRSLKF